MPQVPAFVGEALDLADEFATATDITDVFHRLSRWLEAFGATAVLVTGLPPQQDGRLEEHILLDGWPRAWHARYRAEGLYRWDPCVLHCRGSAAPFLWSQLPGDLLGTPQARRVMHEAAEFDLVEGLCIPLHHPHGLPAALTTAGRGFALPRRAQVMAQVLAHSAYGAALRLGGGDPGSVTLSEREGEVLRWAAAGKTAWETAMILGLHVSTVEKHLRTARDKLDAMTTPHAVAKALARRLIQP